MLFRSKNAASRKHLASLVERLRESDLRLLTEEGGWTIAQALGHLAFWDRSMATRWRMVADAASDDRAIEPIGIPDTMMDAINIPLAGLVDAWTSQIGAGIGRQALEAAEEVDALVVELAGRLPDRLALDRPSVVNRWSHREAHLAEVEKALAAGRPDAAAADRSYVARNDSSLARLRIEVKEAGQGLAEYALILALIAIVAISALLFLGGGINSILSAIGSSH